MSRKKNKPTQAVDPFAEREAQKYEKPIPSREFILNLLSEQGQLMTLNQLAHQLQLDDDEERLEALRRRMRAMERDGQVIRTRRNAYGVAKKMDLVRGRVVAHPDGFGFLVADEGGDDVFLSEKQMRSLLHGDRALVSIAGLDRRGRREGILVEVLERHNQRVVGRFFMEQGVAFVEPDNRRIHQDIMVPLDAIGEAKHGQIVVVELQQQPSKNHPPIGQIIEVMGEHRAPGMEIDIAIRAHELPNEWSEETLAEIAHLTEEVPKSVIAKREDMRAIPFVTIDGEDARDFDDAVHCEPRGRGWLLRVAIADVSSYVKPDTALDVDAKSRGNSVYFPNQVVPMLPEILSNGLCSLKPKVDRLALVCEMAIDMYGRNRRTRYFEAVIHSAARLTYTQVAKVLDSDTQDFPAPEVIPQIEHLKALFLLLQKRRQKQGAIDFDTPEMRIIFDDQRKIDRIVPTHRNDAHRLIEEMMLVANVASAEWLAKTELPILYRNHEGPNEEKLAEVRTFLAELGLRLGGKDEPKTKHYAQLVEKIQDRPDKHLVQTVLLRSMKMATYSPDNLGHFGLSFPFYTHFTSPIRRYPDLLIHRAIKHHLHGRAAKKFSYSENAMRLLGEHCSMTERRAEEATRDALDALKCEYMQDKVGNVYEGLVSAVTSFGLFVTLNGMHVDGLIHVTNLHNDYYHFDPVGHKLQGERTGVAYRLSDRLTVRVVRVDVVEKKIDFELVEEAAK